MRRQRPRAPPLAAPVALDDHGSMLDTVREGERDTWELERQGSPAPEPTTPRGGSAEGLGRYVVLRQLGRGAMGVVFAAYDPSLDRKVAIKVLRGGIDAASEGAARMRREAQAMARLSHPNVAQVHEVGEADGRLYLVMEYVEGVTLGAWLAGRPRAMGEVLRTFIEAGRGLAAAHAAGLIHRDFKPDNAMIGADGRVRVLDFGLSRSVLALPEAAPPHASASYPELAITVVGTLIGTPAYMSPEQHMRREADARSDQFSFCVALYEALYGQRPFTGADVRELGVRVVTGTIAEPPAQTRVPGWLRQVLLRGLKPDPAARWPDMDALLAALDRDPQRTRRRWLLSGLAAVAVAGVSYGVAAHQVAQAQICSGAAEELRDVWDPSRRAALEQAVRASGSEHPDELLASVTARLDEHAGRWVASHTAACEAHRRGHASAQLFDRKMACLRQRRTELAATVEVLTQTAGDGDLVEAAVLPSLAGCEDDARLLADVPLPTDPELAAEVERARGRLARLQALERAGRFAEALALLGPELAAMHELGDLALLAETHLLAGKLHMHRMEGPAGRVDLDRALQLGLETRLDAVAAEALTIKVFHVGVVERRGDEALALVPLAWSLVRRVGSPARLAALLHNNIGSVHDMFGDQRRSIESLERGLELLDPAEDEPLRWVLVQNLAEGLTNLGEFERARQIGEPVMRRLEQLHGRCHPLAASLRSICSGVNQMEGDFAAAIADYESSVACFAETSPILAMLSLKNLVDVALVRGDDAAARGYLARVDAIAAVTPDARPHLFEFAILRADLELRAGHHEAARRGFEAERARLMATRGANDPIPAIVETRLAILAHLRGEHDAALVHLQRAPVPIYWPHERGLRDFTHARVLHALGRAQPEVAALARQAAADYQRAGRAYAAHRVEIEEWLAALPPAN
jgi:tetratricopeptide (TPR) repeat protein/predicted Ser/Thr protein kinase